ncbi:Rmt family 16S rRNA (guanine(1405)-N(7))-methyltransferase [Klebsiella pneumoniae]|uniref:Rmt family 16S rRNA (guanine(1405)-N(7))-methyltransferase n=1 Tax=Klebsiella pneumoniae TaxID=573 RepID=UPI001D0D9A31|nr:Rmt family 16S rRNA (guanine(1405)-N(7))-methyltransferase [Klebsiella pneumoniae]
MDERAQAALDALLSAKNLRDVCPETVRRVFMELLPRYRKPKDAEKAARTHLHQITGAFMTADAQKKARALLARWNEGDESALAAALSLHASTRERLPGADEWMRRVSPFLGADARARSGLRAEPDPTGLHGRDERAGHGHSSGLRATCERNGAGAAGIRARACDLLSEIPAEEADAALLMKLLPVLEAQKTGRAAELLASLRAPRLVVTFPTRTLGGRGVGMEKHYADWFERILPDTLSVRDRFTVSDELVYLVERT